MAFFGCKDLDMRVHDCILGLLIILSGLAICYVAIDYPDQNDGKPGPWLFPVVLSLIFAICGLILFIKGLFHFKEHPLVFFDKSISKKGVFNIFSIFVLVIFYINFSETLGFLICMEIVLLSLMLLLKTKFIKALIVSVFACITIYLIFSKGLLVPLPEGILYF